MRLLIAFLSAVILIISTGCNRQPEYQSRKMEVFPAVQIKYAALYQVDGLPVSPAFFQGQWTLVIFGQADCAFACQQRLALLNSLEAVKKLFVIIDLAQPDQMREFKQRYPQVAISMGTTAVSFDRFYAQFKDEFADAEQQQARIFLVNPAGVLSYWLSTEDLKTADIQMEMQILQAGS